MKFTLLNCFLPAIFNDDVTDLNEDEIAIIQKFVDSLPACIFGFKDTETNFKKCELTGLAGDCVELTAIRPHFKTRFINCRRASHTVETVDQLDNWQFTDKGFNAELNRLVSEYQISDKGAYYYVSNRSTKDWRQDKKNLGWVIHFQKKISEH